MPTIPNEYHVAKDTNVYVSDDKLTLHSHTTKTNHLFTIAANLKPGQPLDEELVFYLRAEHSSTRYSFTQLCDCGYLILQTNNPKWPFMMIP